MKEKGFIPYIMAGYPDLETTVEIVKALDGIVTAVEIGVPFSDPLADGPVIHNAASWVLKNNKIKMEDIWQMLSSLTRSVSVPIYVMTYFQMVHNVGIEDFIKKLSQVKCTGVIIPDLPLEEAKKVKNICDKIGQKLVMFITPVTDDKRVEKIINFCSGFLYYVSVTGTTGERDKIPSFSLRHISYVKRNFEVKRPIFIGFGISKPEHVKQVHNSEADGVIVGSALMKQIDPRANVYDNVEKVRRKVLWLRGIE